MGGPSGDRRCRSRDTGEGAGDVAGGLRLERGSSLKAMTVSGPIAAPLRISWRQRPCAVPNRAIAKGGGEAESGTGSVGMGWLQL